MADLQAKLNWLYSKQEHDGQRMVIDETKTELRRLATIVAAFERSGLDLSPCLGCGLPVMTVPDGMPAQCDPCYKKEERDAE